ncbi:MAG: isoprenylcysteine carboxylmethyltransferase family protein [Bryobacteraceae bacterium]|jgi:protein-S-isoprenylcysteine O-methyltransferase
MRLEPYGLVTSLWIVLGAVWAAGALTTKQTRRREAVAWSILHVAVMALAFGLVFGDSFRPGPLHALFLPATPAVQWTGFGITVAGIGIAVVARVMLGGNWSSTVTLKKDHTLIRSGPYAVVRHPIYSGLALALLGTAVSYARVGALLGVVVAVLGWRLKSRIEEAFMEREFGAEYTEYKRRVKALIPLLW